MQSIAAHTTRFSQKNVLCAAFGFSGPPCFLWIFMDLRLLDWCLFWMILKDLVCMDSNSCLIKSSLQIGHVTWTLENLLDIIRSPCALLNMGGYSTWRRLWHEVGIPGYWDGSAPMIPPLFNTGIPLGFQGVNPPKRGWFSVLRKTRICWNDAFEVPPLF